MMQLILLNIKISQTNITKNYDKYGLLMKLMKYLTNKYRI